MKMLLELLRIIISFAFLGGLCWIILENIYTSFEVIQTYSWLGAIAILLLLFVLYRNKLQFTGWYKGTGREKLSNNATRTFIFSSIILVISPVLLSFLLS